PRGVAARRRHLRHHGVPARRGARAAIARGGQRGLSVLTRSGLGAAVTAVVLAVCGWWWHYEELLIAAGCIVVAIAVALWGSRFEHRARIGRRIMAPRVARGDPIRVVYRATNPSRR